ncbi:hypothetical protein ZOSMA_640G00010 [Zostera marina]|uniref:40S ribosomal protein S15 n=1 Tax=Zostera marina TaxID=29655 RepID=A0A0K9NTC6_ZOSMR|nr:hypothetical protein ZOSMA_640G00010 [Zostera marina]
MAEMNVDVAVEQPKRRTFRKFAYRGVDLEQLLDMGTDELVKLFPARARRRFHRGLKRQPMALIKKLRKAILHGHSLHFQPRTKCGEAIEVVREETQSTTTENGPKNLPFLHLCLVKHLKRDRILPL